MLSGEIALKDLPEAFDAKMREYLGLQPPDVVAGVLQDVHWSDMSMGYFPTYALGNVVSVQLWERAEAELGDLDEQFERGEFAPLREWLRENVHRHGRAFTPQELLQRAAGSHDGSGAVSPLPRAEARRPPRRRGRMTARDRSASGVRATGAPARVRGAVALGGFATLAAGLALLVLPGPGLPLVAVGLGLLALEFRWAEAALERALRHTARVTPSKRSHRVAGRGAARPGRVGRGAPLRGRALGAAV